MMSNCATEVPIHPQAAHGLARKTGHAGHHRSDSSRTVRS